MIIIIDYGSGNVSSVKNTLDFIGVDSKITSNPNEISEAQKIIFPGVGAFGYAMQQLREKKLEAPIQEAIKNGKPFLGICLGLQLLLEESEESPGIRGLSIYKGKGVKFTTGKIPQIGWNETVPIKPGLFERGYMYFVNSYHVMLTDEGLVATKSNYMGEEFVSAIKSKNVTAVQFHPEKSGEFGIDFLKRWLNAD